MVDKKKEVKKKKSDFSLSPLEKISLKRLRDTKTKKSKEKTKKPNKFIKFSNRTFYNFSKKIINKGYFSVMEREIIKANIQLSLASYVSLLFFSTLISFGVGFLVLFFITFLIGIDAFLFNILKYSWIVIVIPVITYLFIYFYPSLEKKSIEHKIDNELSFAVINMSAVSSSITNPSDLFKIVSSTGDYPSLEKEFTKIENEVNVYGYDLVTALNDVSFNSPSKKLSELLSGLSTSLTTGGSMREFFKEKAKDFLFEYRLKKEKEAKFAETFMDIYISVVIAAPMIFMLLLIIMKIGGLPIPLSSFDLMMLIIVAVSLINAFFILFLHLKQSN
ncbi:MAG: type II secretion system F family protein [Nanoarchaeota archaeon]